MIDEEKKAQKKKSSTRLLWKIPLITLGVLLGLILAVLAAVSFMLTPERLSKLVEEYGSEYLVDGKVEVERVEIFIWSTFPHFEMQVDDLTVRNLNENIPEEFQTVAAIEHFSGRLNVVQLLSGVIEVQNIELVRPQATFWEGAAGVNSLSILPESAEEQQDSAAFQLPEIKLSRMAIEGNGLLRYVSTPNQIDAAMELKRISVQGSDSLPAYALSFSGGFAMAEMLKTPINIGIDGSIGWNPSEPDKLELGNFIINLNEIEALFSTKLTLGESLSFEQLDLEVNNVPLQLLNDLMSLTSDAKTDAAPLFESEGKLSLSASLKEPYALAADSAQLRLPVMHVEARLTDAPLSIPQFTMKLDNLAVEVSADIAQNLSDSKVDLKRLQVKFPAADFVANGSLRRIGENPKVNGTFRGMINFSRMDRRVWQLLGMKLKGRLNANVDFNFRLKDLTPHTFHRTKLTGEASLRDFLAYMPDDSIAAGLDHAKLSFGSSRSFTVGDVTVDSLLAVSFKVDSAWVELPELNAELSGLAMGLGIENRAASSDTSTVTPMGGNIKLKALRYRSLADSSRAFLRNLAGEVSIRRYNGENRVPRVGANLNVGRVFCSNGAARISLRNAGIFASGHYTPAVKRIRRTLSAADSLKMRARRDSALAATANFEQVDFGVDRSAVSLLRRWNVSGGVTAERGRYASPAFPLRTTLQNLNFSFNADSLMLKQLNLRAGQTDFELRGLISNIQRAMGRRRAGAPLKLNLQLLSDTLNVNEITQALFRGAGADDQSETVVSDSEEISDSEIANADTLPIMAPVVPMNIDAKFMFNAKNVVYSTMLLHDFKGEAIMAHGAAHLRDMHASSPDLGAIDLNLLYYAPTRADVNFGLGLDLNRFNIGKVGDVIPALDSIMPMLNTMAGMVDLKITATTPADSMLNVKFPEMKAMLSISGDSLTLIDPETYKTIGKWLMFKNKQRNLIDHIEAQLVVENSTMSLYPFMFDFDRYRLGVMGHNDLDLNLDYHVSVLKSPLPFKFGINVKGSADDMKIRLGKARFKEEMAATNIAVRDTVRMNLAKEMQSVIQRGTKAARLGPLRLRRPEGLPAINELTDTLSASDSLYLQREGLIELPDSIPNPEINK